MSKFLIISKYLSYIIVIVFLTLSFTSSEGFSVQKPYHEQNIYSHVRSLIKKHINERESLLQITIRGELIYTSSILETDGKK